MKIGSAEPDDIRNVAMAMRDGDFAEFSALSFAHGRDGLAEAMVSRLSASDTIVAGLDEPICVGATLETRPNVVALLFFATERFPEIGVPITRFIVQQLLPRLRDAGAHRFETLALASNMQGRRWLSALGLSAETGTLRRYGRNGEDFVQYSWVKD